LPEIFADSGFLGNATLYIEKVAAILQKDQTLQQGQQTDSYWQYTSDESKPKNEFQE